jgi:hypothetical protein
MISDRFVFELKGGVEGMEVKVGVQRDRYCHKAAFDML